MKNWNSVEEKWREQLQNKSEDIPEGLWSRIEERLEEKPTRRFPIYWAAAAMLLLALGLSWNWNTAPEEAAEVTRVMKKTVTPAEKVATTMASPVNVMEKDSEPNLENVRLQPESQVAAPATTVMEESVKEEFVASVPATEKKDEVAEIITVRLDINPIVEEEEVKPVFTRQKRRNSAQMHGTCNWTWPAFSWAGLQVA